jgi:hypothetical protein
LPQLNISNNKSWKFISVCFDKADKTDDQVPEKMEFEVDLVPEKLSSENESAMAVEQETVEAEKSKENPDQSPGTYFQQGGY